MRGTSSVRRSKVKNRHRKIRMVGLDCPDSILPRVGFGVGFWCGRRKAEKAKSLQSLGIAGFFMELLSRFELLTSSLPMTCSTY